MNGFGVILAALLGAAALNHINTDKEVPLTVDVVVEQEVPYILKYIDKRVPEREAKGSCNLYLNLSKVKEIDLEQVKQAGFVLSKAKPKDKSKTHLNGLTKISWCHRSNK